MSASNDDREQGVDFGDLDDELDGHDYPAEKDELVEEYGDHELKLPGGEMTFEEALEGYEPTDGEFEDADAVRSAVKNMVDSEAVGSEGYSDRGTGTAGEESDSV
ncbi:hypothetical protein ACFO0N_10200 [Halobium salinum]|uniref:DUF2795 domain-containing protein n=1 Tax=Halobium salinum TaxID=1364940 RepID=A0ABD5PBQ0_9EURY|nr:hypothetical protein [Halobium salinum]